MPEAIIGLWLVVGLVRRGYVKKHRRDAGWASTWADFDTASQGARGCTVTCALECNKLILDLSCPFFADPAPFNNHLAS